MDMLYHFFLEAVGADASDIHLKIGNPPIYRLDGQLYTADAPPVTEEQMDALVDSMLNERARATFEKNMEVDFAWNMNEQTRFRVNLFHTGGDRAIVMRYVKNASHSFESLHLPDQLAKIAMLRRGIVLLAGTTGSGKSTRRS